MMRPSARAVALASLFLAGTLSFTGGCVDVRSSSTPTSPTVTAGTGTGSTGTPGAPGSGGLSIQAFSGAWVSGGLGDAALPTSCTAFDYRVTPGANDRSGSVVFKATCAGVTVEGTGTGVLNGDVLSWTAQGTASRAGLACPFVFDNSTAALEGGGVRVNYRGTVCGLPISGSELLRKGQ